MEDVKALHFPSSVVAKLYIFDPFHAKLRFATTEDGKWRALTSSMLEAGKGLRSFTFRGEEISYRRCKGL